MNRAVAKEDEAREDGTTQNTKVTVVITKASSLKDGVQKKDLCRLEPISTDGRSFNNQTNSEAEVTVFPEDILQGLSLEGIPSIYIRVFCPS